MNKPSTSTTLKPQPIRRIIRTRSQSKLADQLQSNQPTTTTCDHSDIFAIIDSHPTSNGPENQSSDQEKKIRVALMDGKTTSRPPRIDHSPSPFTSQPNSPDSRRPLKRVLSRVLSSGSMSSLFGTQAQPPIVQPSQPPSLDFQLPIPTPQQHEPINTNHLVNLFSASHQVKKTYGAQRTFKPDEPQLPPPSSARYTNSAKRLKTHATYNELRKTWGVDQDDDPLLNQPELQSILHQRSSGTSKRFTDVLLYLIEGLSPGLNQTSDLDLKRSNAIEFIRKFKDESFLEQLRSNGLIEQFYNSFRAAGAGDGDPILDHALLIFISAMCCSGQKFIEPILRILPKDSKEVFSLQSDCLQVLASFATRSTTVHTFATTATTTTSTVKSFRSSRCRLKQPQLLASQIQQVIQESVLNKHLSGSSSPTLLSLFSLGRIAMFVPRPGLLPQRLIVQSGAFVSVITALQVHSRDLYLRFKNSYPEHGVSKTEDGVEEILKHVGYCVDVIEACTVCSEEDALNLVDSFRDTLVSVFSNLIESGHFLAGCDHSTISNQALDISIGCIRTMVNITNLNSVWADQLSTPSVLTALFGFLKICREAFEDFNLENKEEQKKKENGEEKLDSKGCQEYHQQDEEEDKDKSNLKYKFNNRKKLTKPMIINGGKKSKVSGVHLLSSSSQSSKSLTQSSESSDGQDQVVFDMLCVTLGLLANLLEKSNHSKTILAHISLPSGHNNSTTRTKEEGGSKIISRGLDHFSGFDELIKLYVRPPCRHLDERKFIRGSICVLINLFLLEDQKKDQENNREEKEKEGETSNNVDKIIQSFNKVIDELKDQSATTIMSDQEEEEDEERVKQEELGGDASTKLIYKIKNGLVIQLLKDLKLHSSSCWTTTTTTNTTNTNTQLPLPSNLIHTLHVDQFKPCLNSSLNSCWDRLRVGLI